MLRLYTDAATKGKHGPSAAGILITGAGKDLQLKYALPDMTNHEAEFAAATLGLEQLLVRGFAGQNVELVSDSQILIDSMDKGYAKHFQPQLNRIIELCDNFPIVIPVWRNDHSNHGAHTLALQALHGHLTDSRG
ncbi:ribonuclease HI family protein [Lacticaseibacillus zhaodongensis]|uniref:ribonuclease HI family protein n=1 Tax=Lacticaseibacillus zhaodongensis TaxID=2668065 RepID=UPI0012D3141E|nr:ribonuclease HI family protein [Lacticaseibacillus zhaodongensis]